MDGDLTRAERHWVLARQFERNRLAGQFLAEVYERVVPIGRMTLPQDEVDASQALTVEGRRAGGCRAEAGGWR